MDRTTEAAATMSLRIESTLSMQGVPRVILTTGRVLSIDVILTPTGAITGFPVIDGCDLSVPGTFNNTTTTGTCLSVFQIAFHVDRIPITEVGLVRRINRTATVTINGAQVTRTKTGLDGPSSVTVLRPSASLIAVSDSPGLDGTGRRDIFPMTYHADFELFAFDLVGNGILAKLTYTVDITKRSFADSAPTIGLTNIVRTIP
jgi:hypothetical protein